MEAVPESSKETNSPAENVAPSGEMLSNPLEQTDPTYSANSVVSISHSTDRLSPFDETEEMEETAHSSEHSGGNDLNKNEPREQGHTDKTELPNSCIQEEFQSNTSGQEPKDAGDVSAQSPDRNESSSLQTIQNSPGNVTTENEPKDPTDTGNQTNENEQKSVEAESGSFEDKAANVQVPAQAGTPGMVTHPEPSTPNKERGEETSSHGGPATKTVGLNEKVNTVKNGKQDHARDADQKTAKRKSSASSRFSRISRGSIDRNPKHDDKTDKNDDKHHRNNNLTTNTKSESPKTTDNKTTKSESEMKSKQNADKSEQSNEEHLDSTHKPVQATKPVRKTSKTANGSLVSSVRNKDTKTSIKESREVDKEQQKKARALLSRAVMRRVASMEKKPTDKTPSSQPASTDLNSSAGSKSLGGKSTTSVPGQPRPAHKTQSIQSLAVPGPGIGSSPNEADDRVSLGSRRDSVSRKSVDYRLQTSGQVVTAGAGEDKPKSVLMHDDSMIRAAIPALPVPLAILCLFLNIVLPGSGTIMSGISMPCCGKSRLSSKGDAVATTVCVNLFVGAAQLGTVTFFLVGWFWSLAWGVKMIILAVERRAEQRQLREKELQALALRAFGSPGNVGRSILPPV